MTIMKLRVLAMVGIAVALTVFTSLENSSGLEKLKGAVEYWR
jgi:hypothetical protein